MSVSYQGDHLAGKRARRRAEPVTKKRACTDGRDVAAPRSRGYPLIRSSRRSMADTRCGRSAGDKTGTRGGPMGGGGYRLWGTRTETVESAWFPELSNAR